MFASSNGLDPTAFPSLLRMENDLVALAGGLLDAPDGFAGSVTSGGTESILLAVLAARQGSPGIDRPEHGHPDLGACGVPQGGRVPRGPRRARRRRPRHPARRPRRDGRGDRRHHRARRRLGSVLRARRRRPGHRDRRAGRRARHPLPRRRLHRRLGAAAPRRRTAAWTFAVDGVTSISVDLHKYAYTPKGVSVLLHRTPALRRGHFFASANWPGYTMLNSTMQSTRSGGPLAAAWAVTQPDRHRGLCRPGPPGPRGDPRRSPTRSTASRACAVLAPPDSTLVALVADDSLRRLHHRRRDARARAGSSSRRCRSATSRRPCTSPCRRPPPRPCPSSSWRCASRSDAARAAGPVGLDPGLAGLLAAIDPATLDDAGFAGLLAAAGLAGSDGALALPRRMAPVNALLDACPPPLREALLLGVLDRLSRPTQTLSAWRRAPLAPRPRRGIGWGGSSTAAGRTPMAPEITRTPPCRTRSGPGTRPRCSSRPSATTSTRRWRAFADREALVDRARRGSGWTYAEFGAEVDRLARALLAAGIGKGDRVGIWAPNCAEWTWCSTRRPRSAPSWSTSTRPTASHELSYVLNQAGIRADRPRASRSSRQRLRRDGRRGARRAAPALRDVVVIGQDSLGRPARPRRRGERRAAGHGAGRARARTTRSTSSTPPGTTGFPKGATL